jgi:hypothetical protein
MGCGCKKRNQTPVVPSSNVVMTEGTSTTNDVQQINLIDQQQVEQLVKKIEEINNSLDNPEE